MQARQYNYEAAKFIGEEITLGQIKEYLTSPDGQTDILNLPAIAALVAYAKKTNRKKFNLWESGRSKHINNFIAQIQDTSNDAAWLNDCYTFRGAIGDLIVAKTKGIFGGEPDERLTLVTNLKNEITAHIAKIFACPEFTIQQLLDSKNGLTPNRGALSDPKINVNIKLAQRVGEELIHIFEFFYLDKFKINYANETNSLTRNMTKFASIFDDTVKIERPGNHKKIMATLETITEIANILQYKQLDTDEKKLNCIESILSDLKAKYGAGTGEFAKTINYAWTYFTVYTKPLPTTTLDRKNDEFLLIEKKFISDVKAKENISMRFEPARIAHPDLMVVGSNMVQEVLNDPPSFGGEDEFIYITKIESLKNTKLLEDYYINLNQLSTDLSGKKLEKPPVGVEVDILSGNLNPDVNEVFLYHGTNLSGAYGIMQNGFNCEKFCKRMPMNGFGPLGRGTYFTDELAKAGTFALCSLCKKGRCLCKTVDNRPLPKVAILNRVALGNFQIITQKTNEIRNSENPPQDYHSRIGLAGDNSEFESNEVAVRNNKLIYPQYLIFYHHYKNLLKYSVWLKEAHHIADCGRIYADITYQIKRFDSLTQLSNDDTNTIDKIACLRIINDWLGKLDLEQASIEKRQFINIFKMQLEFKEKELTADVEIQPNIESINISDNNNNNNDQDESEHRQFIIGPSSSS